MDPTFNPDGWVDIIPYVIAGLPGVIAAAATWYGQQKSKERWDRAEKKSEQIHYEVKNAHATNLRDDIDLIHADLKSIKDLKSRSDSLVHQKIDSVSEALMSELRFLHSDISVLRERLATERQERIEGDRP